MLHDELKNLKQIQASVSAFAAILCDRSVVTWGSHETGGDSSTVQDDLKDAQQIHTSFSAFAAIFHMDPKSPEIASHSSGGNRAVQDQLKNAQQIMQHLPACVNATTQF